MTIHVPAARRRGILLARADATDPKALFEDLRRTVETFKAEHQKELADIKKGLGDVVQTEKVDRINAEITSLQQTLDQVNATIAALRLGAGGRADETSADVRAHSAAFREYFKTGTGEAGLRDLEVKAGLTSQSKPDGGYLTPGTTETAIDRVLGTVSAVRSLASVMQITSSSYSKFVNQGGAGSGWVGEEETSSETSTPTLRSLDFPVMELYAQPFTTQTLLDDGIVDIEAWLADEVSTTFAEQEGAAFVSGNGVKRPRGFLSYTAAANASYSWGNLGYIASGGAADFASSAPGDALIDLFYALKAGYRANASWIMNDATVGKIRKLKDGQGNYLWQPPSAAGGIATILEKPLVTDDNMPAVAANALAIAFGDFKRGYLILDRVGVRVLRDPYTVKGKVGFYTTKRVGGGVANFEAIKLLKIATS